MVKLVDFDHKWALLIGRLFIAFGSIERFTYDCLHDWLRDPIFDHIKHMPLGKRFEIILDLVNEQEFEKESLQLFSDLIIEAKALSKKRNIVAHNPLLLNVFETTPHLKEFIQSNLKENANLSYDELKEISLRAEELSSKLIGLKVKMKLGNWTLSSVLSDN